VYCRPYHYPFRADLFAGTEKHVGSLIRYSVWLKIEGLTKTDGAFKGGATDSIFSSRNLESTKRISHSQQRPTMADQGSMSAVPVSPAPRVDTQFPHPNSSSRSITRNGFKITTRKLPILKAGPIDEMTSKLGFTPPEMIFGDNVVAIEHPASGWGISFNSFDALDLVDKTGKTMLQVAYSKEWHKSRCDRFFHACGITPC
jgi:hypothetical protein